jgi:hypothetical protein
MEYIKNNSNGSISYIDGKEQIYNKNIYSILNEKYRNNFIDKKYYHKILIDKFHKKYKLPIYINSRESYILTKSLKDYDCIMINLKEILSIYVSNNHNIKIMFYSGNILEIKMEYKYIFDSIKMIEFIENRDT